MRPALAALSLLLACGRTEPARSQPAAPPPAPTAIDVAARGAAWDRAVASLADSRAELAAAWRAADTPAARATVDHAVDEVRDRYGFDAIRLGATEGRRGWLEARPAPEANAVLPSDTVNSGLPRRR